MVLSSNYTQKPEYERDTRQFVVVKHHRSGIKTVWEAYIRASFVSEWFLHNRGTRKAMMAHINHASAGQLLPLGEPDWFTYNVLENYTSLPGDVIALRASWPSESELAL